MSRSQVLLALVFASASATLCCVSQSNGNSETEILALGGSSGCALAGAPGSDFPGVRGFTRSDGVHEAAFRVPGTVTIKQSSGTPLGSPVSVANGALLNSNAWGYKRHDGPDNILYLDFNGHPHEVGSQDIDFTTSYGINAPAGIAADIIGYARSDAKSGMVYRNTLKHVVEITSNFSGSPPWVANDLTTISGALYVAAGNAFPYVRSNGSSAIVYKGTDGHIHELSNVGPAGWFDNDLHAITHETIIAASDPWAFLRADNTESVQFVGTDAKLHQFLVVAASWTTVILPTPFGTVRTVRPSGYVGPSGVNSIVYDIFGTGLHQLTQSGAAWTDQSLLLSSCISTLSEPFGHKAPGDLSSILFLGKAQGGVAQRYELSKPAGGSWTLATF
jgi:hypothetical protein